VVYIVKNNIINLKMKKLNPFLFVAILLSPFSLSAQTFPLLNNAYSLNCSDITARTTTYWQKNSDGEIIKYLVQLKENNLSVAKGTVKKYGVDGNKLSSELIDGPNQNLTLETLELKPDGKGIRIFNYSSGGEVLVKNGKLASDETREMGYQSLCEPNSAVAVYMKTQFQTLVINAEVPAPKKLTSEGSTPSNSANSGWQSVHKDSSSESYIDPTSVKRKGKIIEFVLMTNFLSGTASIKSAIYKQEINCAEQTRRPIFTKIYKEQMASGLIEELKPESKWSEMAEIAIGGKMAFASLCKVPVESISSKKKSDDPEINEKNCKAVKAMGPSSFEALASQYRKSIYDFSFIRTEWDTSSKTPQFQCKVIVSTPSGPIKCNTDAIAKNSNGTMFVFIENALSKAAFCY
jgi:hypothetical protein